MYYLDPQTNKRYQLNTAFTHNGIQYMREGANHDTFTALGFTQVIPSPRPDDRFYIVTGPDIHGQYTSTPRDLEQLKQRYIVETKRRAHAILVKTDWMVIRNIEVQTYAVTTEVTNHRQQVRSLSDLRCAAISNCSTIEELKQLVDSQILQDN